MQLTLQIGLVLFGGYFVLGGAMHFMNLSMMTEYAGSKGVPAPKLAAAGTGILLMVAGLGIVFGIYRPLSLLAIAAFLVVITPIMHNFWKTADANARMVDMQMFLKNAALLGASLALYAVSV